MKKILIVGVTGSRNRGVEALVVSTLDGLQRRIPEARITVITDDAEFDRWRFAGRAAVSVVQACGFRLGRWRSGAWVRLASFLQASASVRHRRVLTELREADLVILSGGDMLSNDYSLDSLRRSLDWARLAKSWSVKCVALGQSIGPFRETAYAVLWRSAAADLDLVTYRESHSRDALKRAGLPLGRNSELAADSAFLLPQVAGEEGAMLVRHYGFGEGRRTVVLVPSAGICRYGKQDAALHIDALVALARHLLERHADQLLLLPHVSETRMANNDSLLALEILRRLNYNPRVRLVDGGHTAVEFKTLIAAADFVISERMHAAIAGLSTGVPTLVIGYSVKALGILSDTLGAELAARCLVSIGDFNQLPPERFVDQFVTERGEIANRLRIGSEALRELAARNFELLSGQY